MYIQRLANSLRGGLKVARTPLYRLVVVSDSIYFSGKENSYQNNDCSKNQSKVFIVYESSCRLRTLDRAGKQVPSKCGNRIAMGEPSSSYFICTNGNVMIKVIIVFHYVLAKDNHYCSWHTLKSMTRLYVEI